MSLVFISMTESQITVSPEANTADFRVAAAKVVALEFGGKLPPPNERKKISIYGVHRGMQISPVEGTENVSITDAQLEGNYLALRGGMRGDDGIIGEMAAYRFQVLPSQKILAGFLYDLNIITNGKGEHILGISSSAEVYNHCLAKTAEGFRVDFILALGIPAEDQQNKADFSKRQIGSVNWIRENGTYFPQQPVLSDSIATAEQASIILAGYGVDKDALEFIYVSNEGMMRNVNNFNFVTLRDGNILEIHVNEYGTVIEGNSYSLQQLDGRYEQMLLENEAAKFSNKLKFAIMNMAVVKLLTSRKNGSNGNGTNGSNDNGKVSL